LFAAPSAARLEYRDGALLSTLSTLRILFVEDNADLREAIGMLIEGQGREVVLCASGEEAIREVARRRFDIIFADVRLPGMSGVELAKRLLDAEPRQRLVLCSGEDLELALEALGPNVGRLTKPFDVAQLERLLTEVAPKSD
jgi:two-component system cell cycle response regulator CpdR